MGDFPVLVLNLWWNSGRLLVNHYSPYSCKWWFRILGFLCKRTSFSSAHVAFKNIMQVVEQIFKVGGESRSALFLFPKSRNALSNHFKLKHKMEILEPKKGSSSWILKERKGGRNQTRLMKKIVLKLRKYEVLWTTWRAKGRMRINIHKRILSGECSIMMRIIRPPSTTQLVI